MITIERYITDIIYTQTVQEKSAEIELAEKRLYTRLSSLLSEKEYLRIEEELNTIYSILEKELFCKGFTEGIRFLMKCV